MHTDAALDSPSYFKYSNKRNLDSGLHHFTNFRYIKRIDTDN